MNNSVSAGARSRKHWLAAAAVLLVLGLAAGALWWSRSHGTLEQQRLHVARERQRVLMDELAKASSAADESCPPGQIPAPAASPAPRPATPGSAAANASSAPTGSLVAFMLPALAERLEHATAIVLVAGASDLGIGTGFFISPNLLVTNRHVVENSAGKSVYLASKALGSLRKAVVLQVTRSATPGAPDFALLRMQDGVAPGTLDIAVEVTKLASVVAAGYPAVVVQSDASFRRLMQGDLSAAPDLNLTSGSVQSFQVGESDTPLIVHTASIAKGNSGGPLVDLCGRVVGVNTFINVDQSQSAKINYAIRSQSLASFLKAARAEAQPDPRVCPVKG